MPNEKRKRLTPLSQHSGTGQGPGQARMARSHEGHGHALLLDGKRHGPADEG